MFFYYILSILGKSENNLNAETSYQDRFSLMHPHVSDNGRSDFYTYGGQYLVKTRTRSDYTQLGLLHPNTKGFVQMKEPLKHKNFKFEIEFSLESEGDGDGCGFWFSDPLSLGDYYGRNGGFKGIGVIIDTKKKPYIKFVDTAQPTLSKTTSISLDGNMCDLVFENLGGKMHVKFFSNDNEYPIYSGVSNFSPSYVFGVSHSTGQSSSVLRINNIVGYTLIKPKNVYVKGETRKSRKLVFFVGFCCIGGLFYYLYNKQAKSFAMKN